MSNTPIEAEIVRTYVKERGAGRRDGDHLDAGIGAVGDFHRSQNRLADVVEADGAISRLVEDVYERDVESAHDIADSKVDIRQSIRVRARPQKGAAVSWPLSTVIRAVFLANSRAWKNLLEAN
jgi:hypothetical protein